MEISDLENLNSKIKFWKAKTSSIYKDHWFEKNIGNLTSFYFFKVTPKKKKTRRERKSIESKEKKS